MLSSYRRPFPISMLAFVPFALSRSLPLPFETVAQLEHNNTWIENFAFRSNGDLLVTQLKPRPELFTVKDPSSQSSPADLVSLHTFDNADSLLGISPVGVDNHQYVVSTIKWVGDSLVPVANTSTLRAIQILEGEEDGDTTLVNETVLGPFPEFGVLNGVIPLQKTGGCEGGGHYVLAADSTVGVVWKIDTSTGAYEVAVDVPEMKETDPDATLALAVNGIKMVQYDEGAKDDDGNGGWYLYWSNSNTVTLWRIRITGEGIRVPGAESELVAQLDSLTVDDFALDGQGNVWVVTNLNNTLLIVEPDGSQTVVLGSEEELVVSGATAVEFGTEEENSHILYVTTSGGMSLPVNGTVIEPGKVLAVDTRPYYL